MKTITRPMTYTTYYKSGPPEVHFAAGVEYEYLPEDGHWDVRLDEGDYWRSIYTKQLDRETQDELDFTTIHGNRVIVRDPVPSDVVAAGWSTFTWPIELIYAVLRGETPMMTDPDMHALVDAKGNVMTLVLMTGDGVYARYSGLWHRVSDLSALDGGTTVQVDADTAVSLYDEADTRGQQVPIVAFPEVDQADAAAAGAASSLPPITASGMATLPVIATASDVPSAVALGESDPSVRWYVEKRARALDPAVVFPW